MVIQVKVLGMLKTPSGERDFAAEVPEGAAVGDLLRSIGFQARHIPHIMATVNGLLQRHEHLLAANDAVELSILLGGG